MTLDKLAQTGLGVKTSTYFKLVYPIYTGVNQYGILHIAIFGMN